MSTLPASSTSSAQSIRRIAPWLVIAMAIYTYSNVTKCQFVFDDRLVIEENTSIRSLWPIWRVLFPPAKIWTAGRPLTGLSLAVNYAIDGLNPRWYHAGNVAIHALAAITLLGVLRLTLRRLRHPHAEGVALAATMLWTVHPLLTDSVTYATNRSEVLMGLFFLLTFYTFLRSFESPHPKRWLAASVASALLSVGAKEVGAMIPLVVLIFDAVIVSSSWKEPFQQRWRYYICLGLTALPLPVQLLTASVQTEFVLKNQAMSPWQYLLLQSEIITRYLKLIVWPMPLQISYYDWPLPDSFLEVWPYMAWLGALCAISTFAVIRRWRWGMIGAWFFLILAPTSSILPIIAEPGGERRMYVPSISIILAIVLVADCAFRLIPRIQVIPLIVTSLIVFVLTQVTLDRNEDFATPLQLWTDAVMKQPLNALAENNLGNEFLKRKAWASAVQRFDAALMIEPDYALAKSNRGMALCYLGYIDLGLADLKEGLRLQPGPWTLVAMGWGYQLAGQPKEGELYLRKALELDPNNDAANEHLNHPSDPVHKVVPATRTAGVAEAP